MIRWSVPYAGLAVCFGWFPALGQTIDMKNYFPQPRPGEVYIARYDVGRINYFRRNGDSYILGDYWPARTRPHTLLWADNWHYRVDPSNGVVEFRDEYPKSKEDRTPKPSIPFMPGYEIRWGNLLNVGQYLEGKVVFDGVRSKTPFASHRVTVLKFLPKYQVNGIEFVDVIKIQSHQEVCRGSTAAPGSADDGKSLDCKQKNIFQSIMYLAPGRGVIRKENITFNGRPRLIATENIVKFCIVADRGGGEHC